jgi:hypothetical protein
MLSSDARQTVELLIRELEAAPGGSAALDQRIEQCLATCFAVKANLSELLVSEGVSWATVTETLRDRAPHYTRSLDASLPGEDILFALRSKSRGKWAAVQRSFGGREVLAWGATEALARRLAALKVTAVAFGWTEAVPARAASASPASEAEESHDPVEWKVRF